jgi:hypothetical protein
MSAHLKKITDKARVLYNAKGNRLSWTDCVKKASKMGSVKKAVKKVARKKSHTPKRSVGHHKASAKRVSSVSGIDRQIGAIKKGSKFLQYRGVQIEKMPMEVPGKGKRKKKTNIFIVHSRVLHSLKDAQSLIREYLKSK